MRRALLFMLLALVPVSAGCDKSHKGAAALSASTRAETPEEAYEHAEKLLKKKYYEQAIDAFERLRNRFPFSKFAVEAELRIADALFAKGDFAEAAEAYRTFARLHPKHERIDYATFRIGLSLFKDAPTSVDRDQTSVELALNEFRKFLAKYPDSEHAAEAADMVAQGRARLAAKELYIGRFYFKDKSYKASIPRFQQVVDRYPETDAAADALFLMGKAHFLGGNREDAIKAMGEYLDRYPDRDQAGEARRIIRQSGGSPPESSSASANNRNAVQNE